MKRGKHASNRIVFCYSKQGKHSKNEIIVYNPIYAKFSACISSLAIATSFLTCLTFGRYKETWASSTTARPARYLLNLTNSGTSISEFIPETTRSFNFYISNFEGDVDNPTLENEVALRYLINIEFPDSMNLPLEYKLYRVKDGTETEITLNNGKSDWIQGSTTSEIHNYRIDLTWQSNEVEYTYKNLTDIIKIGVESEQIDN